MGLRIGVVAAGTTALFFSFVTTLVLTLSTLWTKIWAADPGPASANTPCPQKGAPLRDCPRRMYFMLLDVREVFELSAWWFGLLTAALYGWAACMF
jgi:hypothetical protein